MLPHLKEFCSESSHGNINFTKVVDHANPTWKSGGLDNYEECCRRIILHAAAIEKRMDTTTVFDALAEIQPEISDASDAESFFMFNRP